MAVVPCKSELNKTVFQERDIQQLRFCRFLLFQLQASACASFAVERFALLSVLVHKRFSGIRPKRKEKKEELRRNSNNDT